MNVKPSELLTASEVAEHCHTVFGDQDVEWTLTITAAHLCAWSAELRVSTTGTEPAAVSDSRSLVTFAAGAATPHEAATLAWRDMTAWLNSPAGMMWGTL